MGPELLPDVDQIVRDAAIRTRVAKLLEKEEKQPRPFLERWADSSIGKFVLTGIVGAALTVGSQVMGYCCSSGMRSGGSEPKPGVDHQEVVMPDQPRNRWEGVNALSGLLAAVLIPIVIAIMGNRYTTALKEREIQSHFVELALSVLKERPRAEDRAVRQWAVRVVDEYSGVPLGERASKELLDSVSLPTPASTASRVYLLAGSREKASALDSLHADLVRAGFNVIGQKPALQDEGRPAGPEVRYFNTADRPEAEAIAEWLRFRLRAPALEARAYRDASARPGYIEIWLGR